MSTPLYDALRAVADPCPLRLDMPGHHGKPLPVEKLADVTIDFTENGRTGDLFGGAGDAIEEAEALWAKRLGFDACLFLTGGSTQGNHTALALAAGAGGAVALDRGSHRSTYNALALLDLAPHYLTRPWMDQDAIAGPIDPAQVDELLKTHPKVKTVSIVSPTYYGVLSDIPAIAAICHAHGAKLVVDGAHGAHLPFLGYDGFQAADLVVVSAHKTLPALGQTALLFANGFSLDQLRRLGAVYGSSSPSYLMMASLDLARDWMDRAGEKFYTETARLVENLRQTYPALRPGPLDLDPTRLVLTCPDGFALAEALREQGIYSEMADPTHVVLIFTAADGAVEVCRLTAALDRLLPPGAPPVPRPGLCPPPLPEQVLSPRGALFAPRETISLEASQGRVSACQAAPYPPGVPVIAPGERIEKKHLAYLERIGYNRKQIEVVL